MDKTVSVVVERGEYGVVSSEGIIIVPFGKYKWIDKFDNGLARVKTKGVAPCALFVADSDGLHDTEEYLKAHPEKRAKWGIINESGEEVLKPEYDSVWNFWGKNRWSITVEKDGRETTIDLWTLPGSRHRKPPVCCRRSNSSPYYKAHYGEYAGTYAQDVAGFSDETINDAFEGDPDAYWNID